MDSGSDRYSRQRVLAQVGATGQARLGGARVLIVGMGALGSVAGEILVRAGVGEEKLGGEVVLLDRDLVELSNLQRQVLYGVADVGMPKAVAAEARLRAVNPGVKVVPTVMDLNGGNVEELVSRADLVVECTDNAQARYLINDVCVRLGKPWVYGGAVGMEGRVTGFNLRWESKSKKEGPPSPLSERRSQGRGPCLRCLFREPPGVGELATCDVVGVMGTVTGVVGALQAQVAVRMLVEQEWVPDRLVSVDVWGMRAVSVSIEGEGGGRDVLCPCCGMGKLEFLERAKHDLGRAVSLCGRGTVQVLGAAGAKVDLPVMEARWKLMGTRIERTGYLVRMEWEGMKLALFKDGRLLIEGLQEVDGARAIYDRVVGT